MKKFIFMALASLMLSMTACTGNSTSTGADNDSIATDSIVVDSLTSDSVVVEPLTADSL